MKRLYFLRHAIAAERDDSPDPQRPLVHEGREKLRRLLRLAARQGVAPTQLWSSPYLRCCQTAEEARRQFPCTLTLHDELQPGGAFEDLEMEDGTMFVGHEPDLSEMIGYLVTGERVSLIELKKASLCGLLWDGRRGLIEFLISPKWAAKS